MQDRVAEQAFYDQLFELKPENEHIADGYDELHDWALDGLPEGSILDLGCGTGGHAIRLARRGYRVTAVDLTRPGVRSARKRFVDEGLSGQFVVADAEHLPFRDNAFEMTWTALLLHHFPRLDLLPAELARVTSRRLAAFEPNAGNVLTWFAFNIVNGVFGINGNRMTRNQRALRPGGLGRLFRRFGMNSSEVHFVDRPWSDDLGGIRKLYRTVTSWLPISMRANKFLMRFSKPTGG